MTRPALRTGTILLTGWMLLALLPPGIHAATTVSAQSIRVAADDLPEFLTDPHATGSQGNQISGVVRRIFQDSRGDFWFGTQDGLGHYDGHGLTYYDLESEQGQGVLVRIIAEDADGNVWFGARGGVIRYDGESFTTFGESDGLIHQDVWSLWIDRRGEIWIGTLGGVSRFDGETFTSFEIPAATQKYRVRGVAAPRVVWCITEDRAGSMWFAAESGVYRYDGTELARIPVMDEQSPTHVNWILEDRDSNLWFATQSKGIIRLSEGTFTNLSEQEGLGPIEVGHVLEDRDGNIWFPAEHHGVYRHDGTGLTRFSTEQGLTSHAMHAGIQDLTGRLWFGGWLGVYRFDGESFLNVTRDGPW